MRPDRRRFLQGMLSGGALAGAAAGCASPSPRPDGSPPTGGDPGAASGPRSGLPDPHVGALAPDRVVRSACPFCNANCALDVELRHGRVLRTRGVADDPVQAGRLCVKADLVDELTRDPRRLVEPMRRVAGAKGSPDSRFEPIGWDEALAEIATRLVALRDRGEAHTIACRTTGRMPRSAGPIVGRFFDLLGSPNAADVGPVCNDAGGNALAATFGLGNFTNGYGVDPLTGRPDLGAARTVLMLGTNQAETHPVTFAHLLEQAGNIGATIWCVDPRRTPTAALADHWVPIRPHADLALGLGMLGHVLEQDLVDHGFVERWVEGFERLHVHVRERGYGPRWAETRCDVPAATIRRMAEAFATARPAAIYCNAGVSHQLSAFTTYRTFALLAAVTGNVGRPGAGCNFMHNTWPGALVLPPPPAALSAPSRRQPAPVAGLPVGPDSFASSILDGVPYRIRALIGTGNPLLASAHTSRVARAFEQLEFFVYTGLFAEESARYADLLLPVASGHEVRGVYMRRDDRGIRWQERVAPPRGQGCSDTDLWLDLARAVADATDDPDETRRWREAFPAEWKDEERLWDTFAAHTPGMAGMTAARLRGRAEPLRWPCPDQDHPGTSTLYLEHPGWERAMASLGHPGKRFPTPSGKIEIWTPALQARLASAGHGALPVWFTHPDVDRTGESIRYGDLVDNPVHPGHWTPHASIGVPAADGQRIDREAWPLTGLVGRSSVVHFAGVTHWTRTGKNLDGVRRIQLHVQVAERLGIAAGDDVVVESPRGAIHGTAEPVEGIRSDCVYVPNGFGPDQVAGDEVGVPRYDRAANTLLDDRFFDTLSGQQAYKCFACRVRRA